MKRIISLFLTAALIAAFLLPFSFVGPVYADTAGRELQSNDDIIVDGQVLPDLPVVIDSDGLEYPYWFIYKNSSGTLWIYYSPVPWVYGRYYYNLVDRTYGVYAPEYDGLYRYAYSSLGDDGWRDPLFRSDSKMSGGLRDDYDYPISCSNHVIYKSDGITVFFDGTIPPSIPTLDTSFDDQVVYINQDETYNLFVNAENVNGTPSINWYAMIQNSDGTWTKGEILYSGDLKKYEPQCYIGGWEYIPDSDAAPYTIMFSAVVSNELGGKVSSVQSGVVILHVTSYDDPGGSTDPTTPDTSEPTTPDSGDDSETLGKLESIETDIQEVQQAISNVGDKVDGLSDKVDQLPDEFKESMGDLMEQEKENSKNEGSDAADQVIDIIPNQSMDFLSALNKLIEVLRYEGTDATLTFPAIYIPAINGLFPRIQIMESQEIDFEYWVNQMPTNILALVRALFDVAIVGYCLKELLSLIGSAVNGFGEGVGKQLAEE